MRTPVRIVVPVAAAALLRTACSSTANDTSGEEVSLITEGTLTVCTNPPYEPFEYEDGDEIVGLDIDADRGLVVPAGAGLASVEELEGLTVGVQQATTGADWAAEQGLDIVE